MVPVRSYWRRYPNSQNWTPKQVHVTAHVRSLPGTRRVLKWYSPRKA
jgi:hypothetical protein